MNIRLFFAIRTGTSDLLPKSYELYAQAADCDTTFSNLRQKVTFLNDRLIESFCASTKHYYPLVLGVLTLLAIFIFADTVHI